MNRRQIINKILHDHIDVNKNEDYTNYKKLIRAIKKLTIPAVVGQSEQLPPKYTPCGGCGADNPNDRCINCFHDFGGN